LFVVPPLFLHLHHHLHVVVVVVDGVVDVVGQLQNLALNLDHVTKVTVPIQFL